MSEFQNITAINIALFPDLKSKEELLACGSSLEGHGGVSIIKESTAQAHITLWMGLVNPEDLKEVLNWIKTFDLKIILHENKLVLTEGGSRSDLIHLTFEDSDLIGYLHRTIHERMGLMRSTALAKPEMFVGEGISNSTLTYCDEFHEKHSQGNHRPHVSIGYGDLPKTEFSALVFDRVGVYQLGNHCTCAKNLLL